MCISPNLLRDGTLVGCRKCWQCRNNRIDTWVGRCIAESKTSVGSTFITLTYGRDSEGYESHARSTILTYSDVQKYFKQLRKRGFPCRYIAVGEYGSERGRAHWHIIVFWQKDIPVRMMDYGVNSWHPERREWPISVEIVPYKRINEPCWPHGFSQWDPVRPGNEKGSIRYACWYINEDYADTGWQGKFAMSKRPPLGAEYFIRRAQRFVDERISPQDGYYEFPSDAVRQSGEVVRFQLKGKIREIFCQAFIDKWAEQVGGHYPHSEFLMEYEDALAKPHVDEWRDGLENKAVRPERRFPFDPPIGFTDADIYFDYERPDRPSANAPRIDTVDGPIWYGPNEEGKKGWRKSVPVESVLHRQIRETPARAEKWPRRSSVPQYVQWLPSALLLGHWTKAKVVGPLHRGGWMLSQKR